MLILWLSLSEDATEEEEDDDDDDDIVPTVKLKNQTTWFSFFCWDRTYLLLLLFGRCKEHARRTDIPMKYFRGRPKNHYLVDDLLSLRYLSSPNKLHGN